MTLAIIDVVITIAMDWTEIYVKIATGPLGNSNPLFLGLHIVYSHIVSIIVSNKTVTDRVHVSSRCTPEISEKGSGCSCCICAPARGIEMAIKVTFAIRFLFQKGLSHRPLHQEWPLTSSNNPQHNIPSSHESVPSETLCYVCIALLHLFIMALCFSICMKWQLIHLHLRPYKIFHCSMIGRYSEFKMCVTPLSRTAQTRKEQ